MATLKQKKLAKILIANDSKKTNKLTMKQAMLDAGYSLNHADKGSLVTKTDTWKQLMDKYLPDKKLTLVHKQGLNARRIDSQGNTVRDHGIIHRYLETAYKIKGRLNDTTVIKGDKVLVIPSTLMDKNNIATKPVKE